MLAHSIISNPVIVGSSVHNIRIERLWRDTFRCVLSIFYQLFYYLEEQGKLNPLKESDIYCLHYVYIPRVNKALNMFRDGWNSHALTTEQCLTPIQLFTSGSLLRSPQSINIDSEMRTGTVQVDTDGVVIPENFSPLSEEQEEELKALVNPLRSSSNYGIDIYSEVQQFVSNFS